MRKTHKSKFKDSAKIRLSERREIYSNTSRLIGFCIKKSAISVSHSLLPYLSAY